MLGKTRAPGSVQRHLLDLHELRGDVLVLRGGDTRAVLEVAGIDLDLKSPEEQAALLEGYRTVLNGLDGPVQLVCQAVRQDMEVYLDQLRAPAAESAALARLRLDHFAFVRDLAARRTLLRHRFFVVLAGPRVELSKTALLSFPFGRSGRRSGAAGGREAAFEAARRQLATRAEDLCQVLLGLGLLAHRLGREELLELLLVFLAPRQAANQRLVFHNQGLTPVVRASLTSRGRRGTA